jgi:hypothetical protein
MGFAVVVQEDCAKSGKGSWGSRQIPPDGGPADIDDELEQFATDARCARTHLADQVGAAKYGALFNESGWVEIFWTIAWDGSDNIFVVHTGQ